MNIIISHIKVWTRLLVYTFLVTAISFACTGSKSAAGQPQGAYRAPGYVRKDYKEILVYAKVENPAYRQKVENGLADALTRKGYHAIAAYKNFDVAYKLDSAQFMDKINELKVDGVLTLDYLGYQTTVSESYRYNGGMYNFFVGGASPYDLETTSKQLGYMRMDFYNLDSRNSQYNTLVPIRLFNGLDEAVRGLGEDCYARLKSDRII